MFFVSYYIEVHCRGRWLPLPASEFRYLYSQATEYSSQYTSI